MKRFYVHPNPERPEYYEVRIYNTLKGMRSALRRSDRKYHDLRGVIMDWSECVAVCRAHEVGRMEKGRFVRHPWLGILFFAKGCYDAAIVSHEMTHAAVAWARAVGLTGKAVWNFRHRNPEESTSNERFAHTVGYLNGQFWQRHR